ncbi:MAG: methyltransferase [bacterium]|nr:methyltransferase [bacterium]
MPQTPREIVKKCLTFESPDRMPRDLWLLPWAEKNHPETVSQLKRRFPSDFEHSIDIYLPTPVKKGDEFSVGEYTDEWGCKFQNIQDGIIGEVKEPSIPDIADCNTYMPPWEILPKQTSELYDRISGFYENTDKFVLANCCPRPWERYQFLRGSENALMDVLMPDEGLTTLITALHLFYLQEIQIWAKSDVDGISFMDDWGAQNQLLIPPEIWREIFKPLYKDYCYLIHAHNKLAFMHTDGNISDIYEDLVEIGVDAVNSQLFCMDMADLSKRVKGKTTFWGEIDRQHILPSEDPQTGRDAVRQAASLLYDPAGGIIAQFEFGPGANPDTCIAVFEEWEKVDRESRE